MDNKELKRHLDKIENLPTLPTIAMEVNSLLQDYNTSIIKLSNVIENDQAIVAKILKLVNSAFFGLRSKVGNIPHAITLLGFNTVRNAVISVSVIKVLSDVSDMEGFKVNDFWIHSVSVAVASKQIADTTRIHNPDDCFIGGLLHDIGKLILVNNFESLFNEIWRLKKKENISFFEAEKKIGTMNHAQIGGYLASRWKLPAALSDTITRHHSLSKMAIDSELLKIIHSADIMINNLDSEKTNLLENTNIPSDISDKIRGGCQSPDIWFKALLTEIEEACRFFTEGENTGG
ncbi:MAG: HDOD domain-containing protein [Desulfobacteraceae bacterium]|jgi:putative nucleotidyltransferase with HDIG domain